MKTKFFTFSQNNSGGYFIEDDKHGVSGYVIIEAPGESEANSKLREIGENTDGFWDYCPCCGPRWYDLDELDGNPEPMIYGTPISETEGGYFHERCFVHYIDGTIKEFKFQ